jgi:hypothetical protein
LSLTARKGLIRIVAVTSLGFAASCFAQTLVPLGDSGTGSTRNQERLAANRAARQALHASTQAAAPRPDVVILTGDRVISQFVDGAFWLTTITVVNLETHSTDFDVLFFQDDGTDFNVPIVGLSGLTRGVTVHLPALGSLTFQTAGTSSVLGVGWATLSQSNSDSVGITAIFRLSLPGTQPQEAVVPAVNQFEQHFLLSFDDTSFITGLALANPTLSSVVITANIRNEGGQIIDTRQLSLAPYHHTSFVLPSTWGTTRGIRGTIEFITSGFGVGALGLRFNGVAFTSINVLENFNWVVN